MEFFIALCVILSYSLGIKAILQNRYQPNIYSRVIWLCFAINNLVSVVLLQNGFSVLVLAGLATLGNIIIFALSLRKSKREFGRTEIIATALLIISLIIWFVIDQPFLNLTIGMIAILIGGIPTYKKVLKDPTSEDTLFWLLFALGSFLTLFKVDWSSISLYLYPLFFVAFDGGMTLLCLRRYIKS